MINKITVLASIIFLLAVVAPQLSAEDNISPPGSKKKAEMMEKKAATDDEAMEKKSAKKSEYVLPYPGILPDHPLFALKKFRDAILDTLIVDPIRKAEFYLLQADKHLNMTVFLIDKSKSTHAVGTIQSSTNFMEKSVKQLVKVKAAKKEIPGHVIERVEKSIAKHIEVLVELGEKAEGALKDAITQAIETTAKLGEEAAGLKQQ